MTLALELERQAEQREDPLRVQEERELDDAAVGDLEHLERPRVVALSRIAGLVLPERRRAVCSHGRDDARAATPGAGADPPAQNVLTAAQPHVERRHRLRRV